MGFSGRCSTLLRVGDGFLFVLRYAREGGARIGGEGIFDIPEREKGERGGGVSGSWGPPVMDTSGEPRR